MRYIHPVTAELLIRSENEVSVQICAGLDIFLVGLPSSRKTLSMDSDSLTAMFTSRAIASLDALHLDSDPVHSDIATSMVAAKQSLDALAHDCPLFRLPIELLIEVYAFSLNPMLPSVNYRLWTCLSTDTARMSFCVSALSPNSSALVGKSKATRLHNWAVRKEWFTAQFADTIENAIAREFASTSSIVPTCGAKDIEIPARLLKGTWTDERLHIMERLVRWGAYILSTPPILDQIPEGLLKQAITQRNGRALDFCMHRLCIKTYPQTMQFSPPYHGGKKMTWSTTGISSVNGIWPLIWDVDTIKAWAEARVEEGDPNGEWLLSMLSLEVAQIT